MSIYWTIEGIIEDLENLAEQAREAVIYLKRAQNCVEHAKDSGVAGNLQQALTEMLAPAGSDSIIQEIEQLMYEIEEEQDEEDEEQ